jgi:hypothetical protein
LALPPWEAVIVQAPAAMVVTAEPDTAHTAGVFEANDTGSRELADADRATGSPTTAAGGGVKVMVCDLCLAGSTVRPAAFTWNDCATSGAAP